jgi:hypothetical protein
VRAPTSALLLPPPLPVRSALTPWARTRTHARTDSTVVVVTLQVDGTSEPNKDAKPRPHPEEHEEITLLWLEELSCSALLKLADAHDLLINANLWMYFCMASAVAPAVVD